MNSVSLSAFQGAVRHGPDLPVTLYAKACFLPTGNNWLTPYCTKSLLENQKMLDFGPGTSGFTRKTGIFASETLLSDQNRPYSGVFKQALNCKNGVIAKEKQSF
jgi:hypothetical protein